MRLQDCALLRAGAPRGCRYSSGVPTSELCRLIVVSVAVPVKAPPTDTFIVAVPESAPPVEVQLPAKLPLEWTWSGDNAEPAHEAKGEGGSEKRKPWN